MVDLRLANSVPAAEHDRRVTFGGHAVQLKVGSISLADKFSIAQVLQPMPPGIAIEMSGGAPDQLAKLFFDSCKSFITECKAESLPKLGAEANLYYATIARSYRSFVFTTNDDVAKSAEYVKMVQELLEQARDLCDQKFQDAEILRQAVDASAKQFGKDWYEEVTAEEMAAIKAAMVGGPRGIVTHSGHWYNYQNGYPVSPLLCNPVHVVKWRLYDALRTPLRLVSGRGRTSVRP